MSRAALGLLLPLWAILLLAGGAWAQDAIELDEDADEAEETLILETEEAGEAEAEAEVDLGTIEVLGRRTLAALLGDAAAVTVLEAETFAGATTLGEVLERVPGADVRLAGGTGQLATVQLRGARANQTLVLLDGAPLLPGGAADLSALPLGSLERVEVVRGPAAARFGLGALGGVVNLVTRRPPPAPRAGDGCLTAPVGENLRDWLTPPDGGTTLSELKLAAGSHGEAQAALSVATPGAQYYLGHRRARNDYSFTREGGAKAVRRNNDVSQQDFWAGWRAGDIDWRGGLMYRRRGVPGSSQFPTLSARLAQQGLWLQAAGESWRAGLSAVHTRFNDPAPYLNRGPLDLEDTLLHVEYAAGALADQRGGWGLKPRLDHVDSGEYGGRTRAGLDLFRHFAHGGWGLDLGLLASSDAGLDPALRLSRGFKLGRNAEAYAAAGLSVRHPDFSELYLTDAGAVQGNPDLQPERALSFEVGARLSGARTLFDAAAFASDYRDSIIFAPVSAYLVRASNTGPARVVGVEALLDHQLADGLWWRTAYTWLPLAEYDSGVRLTGRARHHANSRLEYAAAPLSAALSLDYTGRIPADLFGNLVIEPRALVGLELSHRVGAGKLGIAVSNLFERQARDSWNYPLPGREIHLTWRTEL